METVKFIYIKATIGKPEHWSICNTNRRVPMPWFLVEKQLSANLKSHIYKHQMQGFAESLCRDCKISLHYMTVALKN